MTAPDDNDGGNVLVVDDERDMCALLESGLGRRGFRVSSAATGPEALQILDERPQEAVLLDLRLGPEDGLALCRSFVTRHPSLPVVVVTGHGSMEAAVGAIRAGAYDFTTKPVEMDGLALLLARAVRHHRLQSEVARLRAQLDDKDRGQPRGLIGHSASMRRAFDVLDRVACGEATVLITGQSGTGKELFARALHEKSARRDGPFVAVNCAALPADLLESELFGHTRGAFTDAKTARKGLFLEASGGTLFLDEIAELPLSLQPKLLRALQEREVRPVGASQPTPFDARLVAATNRDLEQEMEEGRFREDLFYRINVIHLSIPPLSRRGNDVLLLAQHFLKRIATRAGRAIEGLTPEAAAKLLDYDWPGNVRELENAMERAVALARYDKVTIDDLPERVRNFESERIVLADSSEHMPTLSQLERRYIERALKVAEGNKTQAAQILGLDRRTLYRKLERYAAEDEA